MSYYGLRKRSVFTPYDKNKDNRKRLIVNKNILTACSGNSAPFLLTLDAWALTT